MSCEVRLRHNRVVTDLGVQGEADEVDGQEGHVAGAVPVVDVVLQGLG